MGLNSKLGDILGFTPVMHQQKTLSDKIKPESRKDAKIQTKMRNFIKVKLKLSNHLC